MPVPLPPSDLELAEQLRSARRIAVIGIKTEAQASQPAYYVPRYLQEAGYQVLPVPVYYPQVREILGQPVTRSLAEISGAVDIVVLFRRSVDLAPHLADIIAKQPKLVWLQLGIRDDAFALALQAAGIAVVQDRCIMVEHRRLLGAAHAR